MGQAIDRDGNVIGEAEGDTRQEVLAKLEAAHPDAEEIRIRLLELEARLKSAKTADAPLTDAEVDAWLSVHGGAEPPMRDDEPRPETYSSIQRDIP